MNTLAGFKKFLKQTVVKLQLGFYPNIQLFIYLTISLGGSLGLVAWLQSKVSNIRTRLALENVKCKHKFWTFNCISEFHSFFY